MMTEWPTLALYWYAPRTQAEWWTHIRQAAELLSIHPSRMATHCRLVDHPSRDYLCCRGALHRNDQRRARHWAWRRYVRLPWRGFSITFAFLLLTIALQVYLGRFEQLFEKHAVFSGVAYTEAHVTLTGMLVVCGALLWARGSLPSMPCPYRAAVGW